jgi:hypothetical protein
MRKRTPKKLDLSRETLRRMVEGQGKPDPTAPTNPVICDPIRSYATCLCG